MRKLPWPEGAKPVEFTISSVEGLPLPRHEVRIRPRLSQWPRGDILVQAEPIPGHPAEGALATFSHGLAEHGLIAPGPGGAVVVALPSDSGAWTNPAFLELLSVAALSRDIIPASRGVGLLGFGAIGAAHATAVRETPGLHLAAVCDRDPARAALACASDPDVRVNDDAHALIDDPGGDVVVISTPPDSHAAWAMAA